MCKFVNANKVMSRSFPYGAFCRVFFLGIRRKSFRVSIVLGRQRKSIQERAPSKKKQSSVQDLDSSQHEIADKHGETSREVYQGHAR